MLAAVGAAEGAGEAGLASGSVKAAAYRWAGAGWSGCWYLLGSSLRSVLLRHLSISIQALLHMRSRLPSLQPAAWPNRSACLPACPPSRYITQHGDECRAPLEVPAGTGDTGEDAGAGSTTFHTGLMHA